MGGYSAARQVVHRCSREVAARQGEPVAEEDNRTEHPTLLAWLLIDTSSDLRPASKLLSRNAKVAAGPRDTAGKADEGR